MGTAMKSVTYRGGIAEFRIPSHWREEYSDVDGGVFYEDDPDSGTLRLKVITISTDKVLTSGSARDVLDVVVNGMRRMGIEGSTADRQDHNALFKYEEAVSERGTPLAICYWVIANPLPPHNARIITFSYTVPAERRDHESTKIDLAMLETEIESATFAPDLGSHPS